MVDPLSKKAVSTLTEYKELLQQPNLTVGDIHRLSQKLNQATESAYRR